MNLKSAIRYIFIVSIFILCSAINVHAQTEGSVRCENACQNVADLTCSIGGATVVSTVLPRNNQIQSEITVQDGRGTKACVSLRKTDNLGTKEPIDCKVVDVSTGSGSVSFDTSSSGEYTVIVQNMDVFRNGDAGFDPLAPSCAVSDDLDITTNAAGTPIPTATPTPICIGKFNTFIYDGTCCDPESDNINGAPFCTGYTCSPIPDIGSREKEHYCADKGGGWVMSESDDDIGRRKGIENVIQQSTGNYGGLNQQCRTYKFESAPDMRLGIAFLDDLVAQLYNWTRDNLGPSVETDSAISMHKATGGALCNPNLKPSLTFVAGKKPSGTFEINNRYDLANDGYLKQEALCVEEPYSSEESCRVINKNKTEPIPVADVASCTCVSPNGEAEQAPRVETIDPYVSDEEIVDGICNGNVPCEECLKNGKSWQTWAQGNKCNDLGTAENNLIQDLVATPTPTPAASGRLQVPIADSQPVVLAATSLVNPKEIAGYLLSCAKLKDTTRQLLCKQCLLSGRFWNAAGCTNVPVETDLIKNLCVNLTGTEKLSCIECNKEGRIWTAIGCVDMKLERIIQDHIFGWGIGLAGISALLCIIYSAFMLQVSGNNPEKITQAQETMTNCITGLIVIIFSVFILNVIGVDLLRIPGFERSAVAPTEAPEPTPTPVSIVAVTPVPTVRPTVEPTPTIIAAFPTFGVPTPTRTPTNSPTPTNTPTNTPTPTPVPSGRGIAVAGAILYQVGGISIPLTEGEELILTGITSDRKYISVIVGARIGWVTEDSLIYDTNTILGLPNISLPFLIPTSTSTPSPLPTAIIPSPTPTPTPTIQLAQYECARRDGATSSKDMDPAPNEVYLYDDLEYKGACLRLTVNESNPDLRLVNNSDDNKHAGWGVCWQNYNDCIASIKVGSEVKAILYSDPNYTGPNNTFISNYNTFARSSPYNDRITSIQIFSK